MLLRCRCKLASTILAVSRRHVSIISQSHSAARPAVVALNEPGGVLGEGDETEALFPGLAPEPGTSEGRRRFLSCIPSLVVFVLLIKTLQASFFPAFNEYHIHTADQI
jgi:hypothetical protein